LATAKLGLNKKDPFDCKVDFRLHGGTQEFYFRVIHAVIE
jgi:hypothetical protein